MTGLSVKWPTALCGREWRPRNPFLTCLYSPSLRLSFPSSLTAFRCSSYSPQLAARNSFHGFLKCFGISDFSSSLASIGSNVLNLSAISAGRTMYSGPPLSSAALQGLGTGLEAAAVEADLPPYVCHAKYPDERRTRPPAAADVVVAILTLRSLPNSEGILIPGPRSCAKCCSRRSFQATD